MNELEAVRLFPYAEDCYDLIIPNIPFSNIIVANTTCLIEFTPSYENIFRIRFYFR